MENSEIARKLRLGLGQEFLRIIDTWTKTKVETEEVALVSPVIESIALIVTAFEIGTARI